MGIQTNALLLFWGSIYAREEEEDNNNNIVVVVVQTKG